jgi:excisionase family DNA binding protein
MNDTEAGSVSRPLTTAQAARLLGISQTTVYDLCRARKLRHYRVGSKYLIPEAALAEFLAMAEVRPEPDGEPATPKAPTRRRRKPAPPTGPAVPDYVGGAVPESLKGPRG